MLFTPLDLCNGSCHIKVPAKFGEGSFVRADVLCIGFLSLVGRGKCGEVKTGRDFLHNPVNYIV